MSLLKSSKVISKITACGGYLPNKVTTNYDLSKILDTSDEWIFSRTGIKSRRIAAEDETTGDLATKALQHAISKGAIEHRDIDCILVATSTPDLFMPATAVRVQKFFNIRGAISFDIQAVCSGFTYGLTIANSFILAEQYKKVAVIGAETMSRIVDWSDRSTCVLFGDGAGAMIVERDTIAKDDEGLFNKQKHSAIEDCFCMTIPRESALMVPGGISVGNVKAKLTMNGQAVFREAVEKMSEMILKILSKNHYTFDDLSWILPHQANIRIIKAVAEKLNIPIEKFITTVQEHANTGAASIPLALNEYLDKGMIKRGQLIVMISAGAGMSFGSILFRW